MGEPININEIAKLMIRMNGLTVKNKNNLNGDIPINYIGLSKGEKLHEKLSYNKKFLKTVYEKYYYVMKSLMIDLLLIKLMFL